MAFAFENPVFFLKIILGTKEELPRAATNAKRFN